MKSYRIRDSLYILFVTLFGLVVITSCTKENPEPQETTKELKATASSDVIVAKGNPITFTDLSLSVANRQWTFPGGTPSASDLPVVDVVFSEEGNVSTTLEIEYYDGTKETKKFDIKVFPILLADFTTSATRIKVGESITFTDKSIGTPTSWNWEFVGGTPATSTEKNKNMGENGII